jgi:hypothetical protein
VLREARESIEQQRRDMIMACYSNPNWDGTDNADKRTQYLKDINAHFNQAITALYAPRDQVREQDVDWSNPFFAAHKREIERTKKLFAEVQGKTMGEVLEDEQHSVSVDSSGNGKVDDRELDQIPRNK